jgi:hypothetical protein
VAVGRSADNDSVCKACGGAAKSAQRKGSGIGLAMKALRLLFFTFLLLPLAAQGAAVSPLIIETSDGRSLGFSVELARTPEEQAQGLMNRPSLPLDGGMLFDFHVDRPVQMWMKNTLIPLDMIFIAGSGKIVGIAERTIPLSLTIISSPGPVRAVLEVNGGTAARLGLKAGDRVNSLLLR